MKEQYAMTEARKLQNRVLFGKVQDDDLEGRSMGAPLGTWAPVHLS